MHRLHIIDGTYELFRAHYSKRPGHVTPDGKALKGTIGFVSSMIALLDDVGEAITHVAAAFDHPFESFRNDMFDGYKTGEGVDPELAAQLHDVEDAARSLGMAVWPMDRYEADDAMATGAARFKDEVEQVVLVTPDKDLGQCLDGTRVVQLDRRKKEVIDEAAMTARRGVRPASIPDFLALVGDAADGIPGIPGFGEKSTALVLAEYGTIDAIPDDAADWTVKVRGAARLAETLAAHRDEARLYKKLATTVNDVPLPDDLDGLAWNGIPRGTFLAWCDRVGARTLRDRPRRWLA